jgi:large subunit ribosomal protein L15
MKLNQIADIKGARHARKRVGRGTASGLGKTSGKGEKGQKARSGVAIRGFEGGQMPLYRRLPKRGFHNVFAQVFREVNLGRLQAAIEANRLDPSRTVDTAALRAAGLIKTPKDGVRLLAKGELSTKITIEVAGASKAAVAAVERAGGAVILTAPQAPSGSAAGEGSAEG